MIFELCPTLSRDLIKREFLNTAAAFGVLVLLGFAAGMIFPDMAQQTLQNFAAQIEQLGLTDDVPQSQMMATLFFNNITASLLSMLYGLIPFLPLSALALGTNALMLGAFAAIYQQQGIGLGVYVLGVLPHGIFELSALILSCALGLLLCRTGTERILKKSDTPFFRRVLDCIRVFLTFSVPLLLVAALIETYVPPRDREREVRMAQTVPARQTVQNMTEGSPVSLILRFALPIFISQVFQQLYSTADAFIVGKYLGTNAFAAVSSSGTLIMLLTSLFIGTAMGAGVAISKYFGAGDYENVSRAIHTNLAFGIVSGTLLTLIGVFLTPTFLVWMNTDAQVMPQAVEYFRYYFLGVLATVLYNMCTSILNALGDSRRPLHYLIISSLVNIALDLLFIGAFRWGVWSAAVATVLSQGTSCVLCLIHLLKKGEVYTVTPRNIRFHAGMLGEIIRYGLPSGIQNCVIGLANVIVQSQINSFGMLAMAAYGAHCKIEGFAFLPITSFTMACTTFVGQNLGAKQYDRAKRGARFCIIIAVVMAELIGLCYYIWASQLISLFDSTPGVVALGVQQARTVALFYCLLAFSHSIAAVCRGAGRAVVPMMIMLSVWCVIRIIYIMLVVHFIGEIGYIYWAYPLTWAISSTIYLIYYLRSDWVHGFER